MKNTLKTKLRIRFVGLSMAALFILLSIIVAVCIYSNYKDMVSKSDLIISQLYKSHSTAVRYFSVIVHPGKSAVKPDVVQYVSVTPEQAGIYARQALSNGEDTGFVGEFRYRIYRGETGVRIIFLSRSASIEMLRAASINLLCVSTASLVAVFLMLIPLSGWVVNPLLENHKKQKQFITAASHELKTPLTVISTNAQMLQEEIGNDPWLDGILQQTAHLSEMTCNLVTLAKADEFEISINRHPFCLGDIFTEILRDYTATAEQKAINVSPSFPQTLRYNGCENEIRQLLSILLDNAFKYCPNGGDIRLSAQKVLGGIHITLCNTTQKLSDVTSLTERFTRGENAANTRGFGIGLSIAQSITARHSGKLSIRTENQNIFIVDVILR